MTQKHESTWSYLWLRAQDCWIFLRHSFLSQSAPVCSLWTGDFVCHHPLTQAWCSTSRLPAFYLDIQPTQPLLTSWHFQRKQTANRCENKISRGSPGAGFIVLLGMGAIAQLLWYFLGSLYWASLLSAELLYGGKLPAPSDLTRHHLFQKVTSNQQSSCWEAATIILMRGSFSLGLLQILTFVWLHNNVPSRGICVS